MRNRRVYLPIYSAHQYTRRTQRAGSRPTFLWHRGSAETFLFESREVIGRKRTAVAGGTLQSTHTGSASCARYPYRRRLVLVYVQYGYLLRTPPN